jgi:riboflavin-specific deaminase-like protein
MVTDRVCSAVIDSEAGAARLDGPPPLAAHEAWRLLLALRRRADDPTGPAPEGAWGFRLAGSEWVRANGSAAEVWIEPATGELLRSRRQVRADARDLIELHGHHATRTTAQGHVVAVLGQSLDGFIATRTGHSRSINGRESLDHLHRVRALSDAVLVGVGTALADRPRLTTRNVTGPHAVRVVVDPRARLPSDSGLLRDGAAPTLVLRATERDGFETRLSEQATALHLPCGDGALAPDAILRALAARGLGRVLVEGGGITVGRFLEAGLIDRLQLLVSPLILGAGRPALPIKPADRLEQALRPSCSCRMLGSDVLFDLRPSRGGEGGEPLARVC